MSLLNESVFFVSRRRLLASAPRFSTRLLWDDCGPYVDKSSLTLLPLTFPLRSFVLRPWSKGPLLLRLTAAPVDIYYCYLHGWMTTSRSPTPKAGEPISRSSSAPETPRPARQTSLEPTITHELLYESSDPFLGPTTSITAQSHQPLESQRTPPASTSRAAAIPPEASSTRHSPPEAPLQRRDSKRMKRESSAEQSIQSESSTGGQPEHETEDEQGPKWEVTTAAAPPKKKRTRTLTTPQQAAELHALLAQVRQLRICSASSLTDRLAVSLPYYCNAGGSGTSNWSKRS